MAHAREGATEFPRGPKSTCCCSKSRLDLAARDAVSILSLNEFAA